MKEYGATCAERLGQYLPKNEDRRDGHDDRHRGRDEPVEEDGQRLVGDGVAEEQRHQQPVLLPDQRQDACSAALFGCRP